MANTERSKVAKLIGSTQVQSSKGDPKTKRKEKSIKFVTSTMEIAHKYETVKTVRGSRS